MKTLWFKAKRYGYGWYPSTWQGWLVSAAYIAAIFVTFGDFDMLPHTESDTRFTVIGLCIVYTLILLLICYRTGEKPRWRWGK